MNNPVNSNVRTKSVVAFVTALLFFTACSSPLLNTYKGSAKDLLPEQVNNYKKGDKVPAGTLGIGNASKGLKTIDEEAAIYSLNNKSLRFSAIVFDSPESATKVLKVFRLGASSEQGINVKNDGEKKKGWSTLGDRFEIEALLPVRRDETPKVTEQIYWTNGSVLFSIMGDGTSDIVSADLKAFEDALAY